MIKYSRLRLLGHGTKNQHVIHLLFRIGTHHHRPKHFNIIIIVTIVDQFQLYFKMHVYISIIQDSMIRHEL